MAKYSIPDEGKRVLSIINMTPPHKIKQIIKELKNSPKGTLPTQHIDNLHKLNYWNLDQIKSFIEVLFNLYRLKEKDEKSAAEIAKDICLSLEGADVEESRPGKNFESTLVQLLSIKNLGLTIKGLQLSSEHFKIFNESRILTDLRFVFENNIEGEIDTGIIIHNLHIEYREGYDQKEFFVAMNDEDLKNLKDQILRAEKKEKSIKLSFKDKVFIINQS